jgi:hypothetical protein
MGKPKVSATISAKTEDRITYDQREKVQRDYEWAISGAPLKKVVKKVVKKRSR